MSSTHVDPLVLTGRSAEHIAFFDGEQGRFAIHREMAEAFFRLRERASAAGFDLRIASGFRDFEAQLRGWNRKCLGERPILDAAGRAQLDPAALGPEGTVFSILRWSMLPGASRHHWGSEIDVYDERARPEGYRIELVPDEVEAGGMFAPLHDWLDENMRLEGFFRPYARDLGGVCPERWHLSYRPVSERCYEALTLGVLEEAVAGSEIQLKETILEALPRIYDRFVRNITPP